MLPTEYFSYLLIVKEFLLTYPQPSYQIQLYLANNPLTLKWQVMVPILREGDENNIIKLYVAKIILKYIKIVTKLNLLI